MQQIVKGKIYNTETAELVASNHYFDGNNWDRDGKNTYLYKTKKGAFFLHHTARWLGERDYITTCAEAEAREHYERLPEQEIEYSGAFGEEPEEA